MRFPMMMALVTMIMMTIEIAMKMIMIMMMTMLSTLSNAASQSVRLEGPTLSHRIWHGSHLKMEGMQKKGWDPSLALPLMMAIITMTIMTIMMTNTIIKN